jgi:hypothetical protein
VEGYLLGESEPVAVAICNNRLYSLKLLFGYRFEMTP